MSLFHFHYLFHIVSSWGPGNVKQETYDANVKSAVTSQSVMRLIIDFFKKRVFLEILHHVSYIVVKPAYRGVVWMVDILFVNVNKPNNKPDILYEMLSNVI